MLPNYAIRFYDDEDVDAFLFGQQQQKTFPYLKEALQCIQFKWEICYIGCWWSYWNNALGSRGNNRNS